MSTVYRVKNWRTTYENATSRKYKNCKFVCVPNKQEGEGMVRILAEPSGVALYGIWCLILGALSKQTERGGWMTSDGTATGTPWTADYLALRWRTDAELVQRLLDILTSDPVGWVSVGESPAAVADSPSAVGEMPSVVGDKELELELEQEQQQQIYNTTNRAARPRENQAAEAEARVYGNGKSVGPSADDPIVWDVESAALLWGDIRCDADGPLWAPSPAELGPAISKQIVDALNLAGMPFERGAVARWLTELAVAAERKLSPHLIVEVVKVMGDLDRPDAVVKYCMAGGERSRISKWLAESGVEARKQYNSDLAIEQLGEWIDSFEGERPNESYLFRLPNAAVLRRLFSDIGGYYYLDMAWNKGGRDAMLAEARKRIGGDWT